MIETDLTSHIPKLQVEAIKKATPMQRLASTIDVAKTIVFLASDLASFTTGQKVVVTGGGPPFL
jgi:3-oxoacyl-[acyl-carrier protein] reductase